MTTSEGAAVPKVLVAEDDPGVRAVVQVALMDYDLLFAEDGPGALDLLAHVAVDVAVLDVMMPRLDGIQVLRRLRRADANHDVPVILLTARVSEEDHLRGFQAGADAYLTKPFDPDVLVATVEEVRARSPRQRQEIRARETAKASLLGQVERRFD